MMSEDVTPSPETELARLQAENVRLRAMIDHLEHRSADEPTPLAAETQIIWAEPEAPAPAPKARSVARPRRVHKQKKRKPSTLFRLIMVFTALLALGVIILLSMGLFFQLGINPPWFSNLAAFAFI